MQSTRQITKAMELVASSRLRGAQEKAISNRSFFYTLLDEMKEISAAAPNFASKYLSYNPEGRPLYIVIAGDRGLAGGYNSNVLRFAEERMPENAAVIPIGKKSVEFFKGRGYQLVTAEFAEAQAVSIGTCYTLARLVSEGFIGDRFSSMNVIYTKIDSLLSQSPKCKLILPLKLDDPEHKYSEKPMEFEGGSEAVFDMIVPEYIGGVLYSAIKESYASEQAARRNAMNSASKNADEMISSLDLAYNRARQAAITQEITEIVAGADQR